MAAIGLRALDAAVRALLVAIGIGAGGAADEAGSGTASKTATQARTTTCDRCPPDCGSLVERNWNMSVAAREYQARVTAFAPGTEWSFAGIDFDGFSSADCMLKEAKSRYDQFLTEGEGEDAEVTPKRWYRAFEAKMLPQAARQAAATLVARPARLTWFFQGPLTYSYMAPKVMAFPPLVALFLP